MRLLALDAEAKGSFLDMSYEFLLFTGLEIAEFEGAQYNLGGA